MVRQKFPKCQCGHSFSDHQKKGYTMFGIGGWCRKCANTGGCDSYLPNEWKPKIYLRSYAYPDLKSEMKMITLEELFKE